MKEKELNQYKAIELEIEDLNRRIGETKQAEFISYGTIKEFNKSSSYFPKAVDMDGIDITDTTQRKRYVCELLRQRELKKNDLLKQQTKIEQYINNIQDSTTRVIFRLYFIDGLSQSQIARRIGYDQSIISRKIKYYLKN